MKILLLGWSMTIQNIYRFSSFSFFPIAKHFLNHFASVSAKLLFMCVEKQIDDWNSLYSAFFLLWNLSCANSYITKIKRKSFRIAWTIFICFSIQRKKIFIVVGQKWMCVIIVFHFDKCQRNEVPLNACFLRGFFPRFVILAKRNPTMEVDFFLLISAWTENYFYIFKWQNYLLKV